MKITVISDNPQTHISTQNKPEKEKYKQNMDMEPWKITKYLPKESNVLSSHFSYHDSRRPDDRYTPPKNRVSTELTRYLLPTHPVTLPQTNYWLEDPADNEHIDEDHLPILCQDRQKHAERHQSHKCPVNGHGRFCIQCFFNCPICFAESKTHFIHNRDIYN